MFYKCFGIKGSKICNSDFYSNACISSIHTSLTKQCSCPFIFNKDGWYPQQSTLRYKQKDLGLLAGQRDHNYSRIPSKCSKQVSQFPVANKVGSQSFQKICRKLEVPDIDLFAFRISHQLPTYISWKLDPFSKGRGLFK